MSHEINESQTKYFWEDVASVRWCPALGSFFNYTTDKKCRPTHAIHITDKTHMLRDASLNLELTMSKQLNIDEFEMKLEFDLD